MIQTGVNILRKTIKKGVYGTKNLDLLCLTMHRVIKVDQSSSIVKGNGLHTKANSENAPGLSISVQKFKNSWMLQRMTGSGRDQNLVMHLRFAVDKGLGSSKIKCNFAVMAKQFSQVKGERIMVIKQQDTDHFLNFLTREETTAKITDYAKNRTPFLFFINAAADKGLVCSPVEAAKKGIFFNFNGITNYAGEPFPIIRKKFTFNPILFEQYHAAFTQVMAHIHKGDTYLLNLTFPTQVETGYSLEEIFHFSEAPYKLLMEDRFVLFSPEIFIKINDGKIFSHPMKGTIDASIANAENILMNDRKELFEHNTIVDLIRNDLAMVSTQVKVNRFRYLQKITTNRKTLLQVSSEISGELPSDYLNNLGEIIFTLLPPGSVTGAPKQKTVEIIRNTEIDDRGFYTGICGFFDGQSLDSAVMIRFIEKTGQGLFFRSGGGITALSDAESEYRELTDKIYVPFI